MREVRLAPGANGAGGQCARCGLYVPRGSGYVRPATDVERHQWAPNGKRGWKCLKWVTEHVACREAFQGTMVHWKWNPAQPVISVIR